MGAATLNMLAPGEAEVSDASLPYDRVGYGTPLPFKEMHVIVMLKMWQTIKWMPKMLNQC